MLIFIEKYCVMKKFILFLFTLIVSISAMSQHLYLVTLKKNVSVDSTKLVSDAFKDLGATEYVWSQHFDYLKIRTKNYLPSAVAKPYLSGMGFEIGLFIEVEEKPIFHKMPVQTKKDSIKNDIERFQ